jgi:hypothetical protein
LVTSALAAIARKEESHISAILDSEQLVLYTLKPEARNHIRDGLFSFKILSSRPPMHILMPRIACVDGAEGVYVTVSVEDVAVDDGDPGVLDVPRPRRRPLHEKAMMS